MVEINYIIESMTCKSIRPLWTKKPLKVRIMRGSCHFDRLSNVEIYRHRILKCLFTFLLFTGLKRTNCSVIFLLKSPNLTLKVPRNTFHRNIKETQQQKYIRHQFQHFKSKCHDPPINISYFFVLFFHFYLLRLF